MATKIEVMNFLKQNFRFEHVSDNVVRFPYTYDDGRTQVVYARLDDQFMVIASPFAAEEDITPSLAFKLADEVLLGITKLGGLYQVIHVVPLADVDEDEIILGLGLVADEADNLEKLVGRDSF